MPYWDAVLPTRLGAFSMRDSYKDRTQLTRLSPRGSL